MTTGRPSRNALESIGRVRIYATANGRYRVRYSDDQGVRHERSAATIEAARRLAEAAEQSLSGGAVNADTPMSAVISTWVKPEHHPRWGPSHTLGQEAIARNQTGPRLGHLLASELRAHNVSGALRDMVIDEGYSRAYAQATLRQIASIVHWGKRHGVWPMTADPIGGAALPYNALGDDQPGRIHRVKQEEMPTAQEVASLTEAMRLLAPSLRWDLVARLAAESGLRFGEIMAIGLDPAECNTINADGHLRVDFQLTEIRGKQVKTLPKFRKQRVAFVPAALHREIEALFELDAQRRLDPTTRRDRSESPYLFRGPRGGGLNRSNWSRSIFGPARAATEHPDWPGPPFPAHLAIHSLRHRYCTDALAAGLRPEDLARLVGHASSRFTIDRYVGSDADYLDRASAIWGERS